MPVTHFRSIPRAPGIDDYVPADEVARAETYRNWSGIADTWPVPLTRIGGDTRARLEVIG